MIDVSQFADVDPEVYSSALQAGDYDVIVQSTKPGITQKGGKKISFELIVEDGPEQTIERKDGTTYQVPSVGRHIFHDQPLPNATMNDGGKFMASRLRRICESLQVSWPVQDEQEFIGKRTKVRLIVQHKNYQGEELAEPRNEIAKWL